MVTELRRPSGAGPRGLHGYALQSYSGPEEVGVQPAAVLGVSVPHPTQGDGVVERVDLEPEEAAVVQQGHLASGPGPGHGIEHEVTGSGPGQDVVLGHPLRHQGRVVVGVAVSRGGPGDITE